MGRPEIRCDTLIHHCLLRFNHFCITFFSFFINLRNFGTFEKNGIGPVNGWTDRWAHLHTISCKDAKTGLKNGVVND